MESLGLDSIINQLSNHLLEGYKLQKIFKLEYEDIKNMSLFMMIRTLMKFRGSVFVRFDAWQSKSVEIVKSGLSDTNYLFEIQHPKGTNMVPLGYPFFIASIFAEVENYLQNLNSIINQLREERNMVLRAEIAEREYGLSILYKITFSDHTHLVKLNHIVIAKTDGFSENDNCMAYFITNPNRYINVEELEKVCGGTLTKRITDIIRDLGFTRELKTIFFPDVSKNGLYFVNPITQQYSIEHELPQINFKKLGRQNVVQ